MMKFIACCQHGIARGEVAATCFVTAIAAAKAQLGLTWPMVYPLDAAYRQRLTRMAEDAEELERAALAAA